MTKWILGPILCAIGIAFIGAAGFLFMKERDSDPVLRVIGPLSGIYIAIAGIVIDAAILGLIYLFTQRLEGRR